MKKIKLEDLPIEWKRGNGFQKSDLEIDGEYKCVLYGELFTKHKNVLIDSDKLSSTNKIGTVVSKSGDILIPATSTAAKRDMILAREIADDGVFLGGDINIIRPQKKLFAQKFIGYYFETTDAYEQLEGYINGATGIIHISNKGLKNLEIPIPHLPEQQLIVDILDEAFAAIAKAKANAEQNLKNAKELFESYLQGVFEKKGDGWEEKTLGEMIEIKNGKNQQTVQSETGEYKIMGSAGNVMGYATDFICEAGTTIIGRKGNISKPLYINERFWNVDTAFGFYPKNEKEIDKRFVYYLCLGIDFKSLNRGTTIPSLVKSELQTIQICFPKSLKIQQTIVKKLDALRAETQKLEAVYQKKITDLEELKKSILQKAFAGEITIF
jgi:type I restriction enzyme S subunit